MKPLHWYTDQIKSEVRGWPEGVRKGLGHQMRGIQAGEMPAGTKRLKNVAEGVVQCKVSGYRSVITLAIDGQVWVVHAFKKDARAGKETRKHHMDLVERRVGDLLAKFKRNH